MRATTQSEQMLSHLVAAGPRGMTWREFVALGICAARFIDTRMRELGEKHYITVDYGRRGRARLARGEKNVKPWKWIYRGPRPVVEPIDDEPRFLRDEDLALAAPMNALTGDLI